MKDIHVVCKKKTRNGPKRVILKSTTNFYGTDVKTKLAIGVKSQFNCNGVYTNDKLAKK